MGCASCNQLPHTGDNAWHFAQSERSTCTRCRNTKTRVPKVANSRDKAAESFLSGSTLQKLFAKTFVRNNR